MMSNVKRKGCYEYDLQWHQNHSKKIVAMAAEAALIHGKDIGQFIRSHDNLNDFMCRTKVNRADTLLLNQETELQRITRYYMTTDGGYLAKVSQPAKGKIVGQWARSNKLTDQFYNEVIETLRQYRPADGTELDSTGLPWDERINTKSRSKIKIRNTDIDKGQTVTVCNDINDASWSNINYDYYIAEAHKLVDPLRG